MSISNYKTSISIVSDEDLGSPDEDKNTDKRVKIAAETLLMLSNASRESNISIIEKEKNVLDYDRSKLHLHIPIPKLLDEKSGDTGTELDSSDMNMEVVLQEKHDKDVVNTSKKSHMEKIIADYTGSSHNNAELCNEGAHKPEKHTHCINNDYKLDCQTFSSKLFLLQLSKKYVIELSEELVDQIVLQKEVSSKKRNKEINFIATSILGTMASKLDCVTSFIIIDNMFKNIKKNTTLEKIRVEISTYANRELREEINRKFIAPSNTLSELLLVNYPLEVYLDKYLTNSKSINAKLHNMVNKCIDLLVKIIDDNNFISGVSFRKIENLNIGIPGEIYDKIIHCREEIFSNMTEMENKYSQIISSWGKIRSLSVISRTAPEILEKLNHMLIDLKDLIPQLLGSDTLILRENGKIEPMGSILYENFFRKFVSDTYEKYRFRIVAKRRIISRITAKKAAVKRKMQIGTLPPSKQVTEIANDSKTQITCSLENEKKLVNHILEVLKPLYEDISVFLGGKVLEELEKILNAIGVVITDTAKKLYVKNIFTNAISLIHSVVSKSTVMKIIDSKIDEIVVAEGMSLDKLSNENFSDDIKYEIKQELYNELIIDDVKIAQLLPINISVIYPHRVSTSISVRKKIKECVECVAKEVSTVLASRVLEVISEKIVTNCFFVSLISHKLFSKIGYIAHKFTNNDAHEISLIKEKIFYQMGIFDKELQEKITTINSRRLKNKNIKKSKEVHKKLNTLIKESLSYIKKIVVSSSLVLEEDNCVHTIGESRIIETITGIADYIKREYLQQKKERYRITVNTRLVEKTAVRRKSETLRKKRT